MSLRPATIDDAHFIFDLRNDDAVRDASFSSEPIEWDTHLAWIEKRLGEAAPFYVIDSDGRDAGYLRFDPAGEGEFEISIAICGDARGVGVGTKALELGAANQLAAGARRLIARVKASNAASRAAFSAAGFTTIGPTGDALGAESVVMVRTAGS